eukprot:3070235-Pyramimonas_sp.AAC.1
MSDSQRGRQLQGLRDFYAQPPSRSSACPGPGPGFHSHGACGQTYVLVQVREARGRHGESRRSRAQLRRLADSRSGRG